MVVVVATVVVAGVVVATVVGSGESGVVAEGAAVASTAGSVVSAPEVVSPAPRTGAQADASPARSNNAVRIRRVTKRKNTPDTGLYDATPMPPEDSSPTVAIRSRRVAEAQREHGGTAIIRHPCNGSTGARCGQRPHSNVALAATQPTPSAGTHELGLRPHQNVAAKPPRDDAPGG
jgi:hypothetical protein